MCAAHFLNVKYRPVPGLNMWFDLWDVRVPWFILPGTQATFYSNVIVPCVVNQTHLPYFKWPRSATIVSHILQFIAVLRSLIMKRGGGGGEGGMQQWRSRDLSRSTGGLCRGLLVPPWEIRERHEQAGRGESWSWPQIAPPGVVFTMVVCRQAPSSVLCPHFFLASFSSSFWFRKLQVYCCF